MDRTKSPLSRELRRGIRRTNMPMTRLSAGSGVSINPIYAFMRGRTSLSFPNAAAIIHFLRMELRWRGNLAEADDHECDGEKSPRNAAMADLVRRAIRESGIPRYRIAKDTGVQESALCRFMQGRQLLILASLDLLAEYLGLELVTATPSDLNVAPLECVEAFSGEPVA